MSNKMSCTIAYLRVSTDNQDLNNQKLEILDYADKHQFQINVSSLKKHEETHMSSITMHTNLHRSGLRQKFKFSRSV